MCQIDDEEDQEEVAKLNALIEAENKEHEAVDNLELDNNDFSFIRGKSASK